jgi:hypothetical protein
MGEHYGTLHTSIIPPPIPTSIHPQPPRPLLGAPRTCKGHQDVFDPSSPFAKMHPPSGIHPPAIPHPSPGIPHPPSIPRHPASAIHPPASRIHPPGHPASGHPAADPRPRPPAPPGELICAPEVTGERPREARGCKVFSKRSQTMASYNLIF